MATHIHEEEQVEALKRWWKENGTSIIAGIVLGVAGVFGWNAWQNYQRIQSEQASDLYMQLQNSVEEGKYELAEGLTQRLTKDFDRTAYADFARLLIAKVAVDEGRLEAAKSWLDAVVNGSRDENLQHIARLRLARVLLSAGKPEEGLALVLSVANPGRFAGQYEEVKGDLHFALRRFQEAKESYRKAIGLGRDYPYLHMKLNDFSQNSS